MFGLASTRGHEARRPFSLFIVVVSEFALRAVQPVGFSNYYLFSFTIFKSHFITRRPSHLHLQGFANAIMEPEASSNASQIVGSNIDNLYGVIDRDK